VQHISLKAQSAPAGWQQWLGRANASVPQIALRVQQSSFRWHAPAIPAQLPHVLVRWLQKLGSQQSQLSTHVAPAAWQQTPDLPQTFLPQVLALRQQSSSSSQAAVG
jgi:hypothetical protein